MPNPENNQRKSVLNLLTIFLNNSKKLHITHLLQFHNTTLRLHLMLSCLILIFVLISLFYASDLCGSAGSDFPLSQLYAIYIF